MRSVTFELILDQLKHQRENELAISIEKQKQDVLRKSLILKNEEIEILKKSKVVFSTTTSHKSHIQCSITYGQ